MMKKIIILSILYVILILIFQACNNDLRIKETEKVNFSIEDSSCIYLKNIDFYLNEITVRPRKWMIGDDNCVLGIVDSLALKFIRTNQNVYIVALDSISNTGDGYIGEYLWSIYFSIFNNSTKSFIKYAVSSENYLSSQYIDQLAMGLIDEFDTGVSLKIVENNIDDYLSRHQKKFKRKDELEFFNFLKSRVKYFLYN